MDRLPGLGNLTNDDWKRLQELVDRFEKAWKDRPDPAVPIDLGTFLPPIDDALRPTAIHELIKADLEIRWRSGHGLTLEDYVERFPELGPAAGLPAELIYEEYRIRHLFGDKPDLEEYRSRFPGQADTLEQTLRDQPLPTFTRIHKTPTSAPAPLPRPDPTGKILSVGGGYEMLEYLGGGGFGKVWRARASGGFEVAVKRIDRPLDQGEANREEEALKLIKELRHPFLVATHAAYSLADEAIIIMELADCSLRDRLKECRKQGQKGIPAKELIGYFREAGEALDYLHSKNLQHRDIKPDNILLTQGHAKLADFGLARLGSLDRSITDSGSGTPPYTAPEVWMGKIKPGADPDQYSLGCTYAELRVDRRLFGSSNMMDLMLAHVEGTPDLTGMPEAEQQVLLRALAKDPFKRFPSCKAFAEALEAAIAGTLSAVHLGQSAADGAPEGSPSDRGVKTAPDTLPPGVVLPSILASRQRPRSLPPRPATQPTWKGDDGLPSPPRWPRVARMVAMGLLLVLASISVYAVVHAWRHQDRPMEVDLLPANCEKGDGAAVVVLSGKRYYDRIDRKLPDGERVPFVLVPPAGSDTEPSYLMADKVSIGLFKRYAATNPPFEFDTWRTHRLNQLGDDRPVMAVAVHDASRFAEWLGGRLPAPAQWDKAAGRFLPDRGLGPYQPCAAPWEGKINVAAKTPRPGRGGSCDYVESPEFGTRIYDLAGNGREWTRELYANNRESVPLAPDRLRKLKPDDETVRVTLRGRSYLASRPLRYEDLEGEDAVPDTHQYQRPAEDIGFRVVIEP